jgi:autotransporter-associated beta strand protein
MSRNQRRLPKSSRLAAEMLEDRTMPSVASPLVAGLDGAGLFSDPVFGSTIGTDWANTPVPAARIGSPAGNAASPATGTLVSTVSSVPVGSATLSASGLGAPVKSPYPLATVGNTFVWTGLGGDGKFSTASNWSNSTGSATATPGNGDSLVFPLNGPSAPGTVTNDLTNTAFSSITFLSNGWTIAGNPFGVTGAINDTTNTAGTNTIAANVSFAGAGSSVGVNVANPASGGTPNQLVVAGNVDLAAAGLTYGGFGTLTLSGTVSNSSGSGGIVADGPGTLSVSGNNTFTGGTTINSGIVAVSGSSTALGTGTITVNNGGTLQLGIGGISNALNLNGLGFGGNGALTDFNAGSTTFFGAITEQTSSSINVGANTLILAGPSGTTTGSITGPGDLTVVGTNGGQLFDEDAGTYTGVTNILGAQLTLLSAPDGTAGGVNTGTSGYVVSQGGVLAVFNNTGGFQANNRLGTSAFVELDGGALTLPGNAATSETFAALNLGNAGTAATGVLFGDDLVNLGSVNNTVNVGTINRTVGSTVTFRGTNFGTGNNLTPGAFGAGAGLVNGILPYANVTIGGATTFATVTAAGQPITAAAPTQTINANTTTNFNNAAGNLLVTGAVTLTLNANSVINSLALAGGATIDLNSFTLTINSGAILTESVTDNIQDGAGGGALLFQNTVPVAVEGIIQQASGTTLNIGTGGGNTVPITVGNNLTLAANTLNFNGATAVNSAYTGTTFVNVGNVFLNVGATADVIPTPLIIGEGQVASRVAVNTNFQQLSGPGGPDNVTVNDNGELQILGANSQTVGTLTLKSGLGGAIVQIGTGGAATLSVANGITSGTIALSPTAGLPGNAIPTVDNYLLSLIFGTGVLQLPASGTFTINVGKTPAISAGVNNGAGGEVDLLIITPLNGGNALLDKTGTGVLVLSANPTNFGGSLQIDGGTFASNVVSGFTPNIVVNANGILGNANSATSTLTTGSITLNGGQINPGLPPSPLTPANSNADYLNQGTATTPNFSAGGILDVHINGFGNTADWDQFQATTGGNQVTLGGTSKLVLDLLGLAQGGTLTGANSVFTWANPLIGAFSDAPNKTGPNILPAADVLNNPLGFQATVSYGAGFLTVTLGPQLTSLSPSSVVAGSSAFTLTVNGSGFDPKAVVNFNGTPLVTAFVSSSQLTAQVPASDIASVGTAQITVTSFGTTTTPLTLTITPPPPPNANGTFFTDGNNQMWELANGKFTNTNAFSELIAAGVDGSGNPEVYFTDGNNLIWRDVNNQTSGSGAFGAPIGAFGTRLAAGRGVLAFTDGANQVWLFNEATGQFVATGAFATRLVAGFNTNGDTLFAITDGANHLYTLTIPFGAFPSTPTFVFSGASALQISVGTDAGGTNEVWFTDGNNTVWRLDQGNFTQTTATATQIAASQGQVFLLDKNHQIQVVTDAGVETNTGGFGTMISASPAFNGVFFLDGTNQIWMFTGGVFTPTGGFGTRLTAF